MTIIDIRPTMNGISFLGQTTSILEIVAMLSGLAGVYLTIRQSVLCFPVGILNVCLYAYIFLSPGIRLYADALLQCIYILLLIYGWIKWVNVKNKAIDSSPSNINYQSLLRISIIVIFSSIFLALFLSVYTDASYPWIDSVLTCASLAAQWMIAKKYIENWIVWIVVNIVYIPLYFIKQLPLTAILYGFFLLMAFKGYIDWRNQIRHEG